MKLLTLTLALASVFIFSAPTSLAQNNAGKVFGAGVQCTFNDGAVKQLPRELCKAYGGTHQ
ncbi:hypothetical protein [Vibrio cyclitrophicus]|uniref:hypothetical protein n=1 Tax=Vibrio cyclitrophicus TaxID=47951 RepID=UPI0002D64FF2|nr:hypothetical protein [Vibrio cyclitrophicus]OCH41936.1 hypothetical protein A6E07_08170 [Vibrio cyclitrophicus]OEF25967.1 hypothetical protein OA9_15385 [Vibrio cyclitrophicus 1F97]OEF44517.1 hypothetical protein OAC_00875 [Vibrio cyclitrophicus 1F273]OEF75815.1 hypothetical protein OA5_00090 [Vibrio cyclitrophicus 1F111]PME39513.1 hypothetical protein BCV36_04805 [Vibrio cyclitrophicus]